MQQRQKGLNMYLPKEAKITPQRLLILHIVFFVVIFLVSPVFALSPYKKADDSWITLGGTVSTVSADTFVLDYGTGKILVEMDDGDRDADAYKLLPGDEVTVAGKIDDDLFEKTSIEASSVHVAKLGATFFASEEDEEDYPLLFALPETVSTISIYGPVTEVDKDRFILDRGKRSLSVDVSKMANNPLDDEGYQKVDVGDYVRVTGIIEEGFEENREFQAVSVTELFN